MDVHFRLSVEGRAYLEHIYQPRVDLEVTKGASGVYRWTCRVQDSNADKALNALAVLESALRRMYGGEVEGRGE